LPEKDKEKAEINKSKKSGESLLQILK